MKLINQQTIKIMKKRKRKIVIPEEMDQIRNEGKFDVYFGKLLEDINVDEVSSNYQICPEEPISKN